MNDGTPHLLTINTGSSSLKAAVYTWELGAPVLAIEESLAKDGSLVAAIDAVLAKVSAKGLRLAAVGHRLVHGGATLRAPVIVDAHVREELTRSVPLAPLHLPPALKAIDHLALKLANVEQVACFDTAFHNALPASAYTLALPHALAEQGVRKYGFHGLSYEYIVTKLRELDPAEAGGRAVVLHLGSGSSIAAIDRGVGIDTTMGLTPEGGIMMATRPGDLDPGVVQYLLAQGLVKDAAELQTIITKKSGLLGVSGRSADMRELLGHSEDPRARLAVTMFAYQAKKQIGAYAAALSGLDTIVFTGGIGQHAAPVRAEICAGLSFLGVSVDEDSNAKHAPVISAKDAKVTVRVIDTDEDARIAAHTARLVRKP